MSSKKTKINDIDPKLLLSFFKSAKLGSGQTFDFTSKGIFCKSANKTRTNIIYREFIFSDVQSPKSLVGQLRLFIYDTSNIIKILDRFKSEQSITITMDYDDSKSQVKEGFNENSGDIFSQIKKITFSSDMINFDLYSSESIMGAGTYISDALYNTIKTVKDPIFRLKLTDSDISKILNFHALTKSDNEVYNIVTISNDADKIMFSHKSHENEFNISFNSTNGLEFSKLDGKYDVSLEIFSNINNNKELILEGQTGGLTALFLTSDSMKNISVMVKK